MMVSLEKMGNGFKIEERQLENAKVDLTVEILKDGIYVTSEKISTQEAEKVVANYLATQMKLYGVEEERPFEECVRLAKKAIELDIVNGYKIIPLKKDDYADVEIQLLKSGRFSSSTCLHNLTPKELAELKEKLNGILKYQLNLKIQSRPLYGIEIITMIN